MMKKISIFILAFVVLNGCVPKKYLTQSQNRVAQLLIDSTTLQNKVVGLEKQVSDLRTEVSDLKDQVAELSQKNSDLSERNTRLQQNSSDLQGLLNQSHEALSENQKNLAQSQRDLDEKQQRLLQLENLLSQQKDALDQLKNKMTDALKGYNNSDLNVYQKNGKVYISLSENLLFPSGSAVVNQKGVDALSKLAAVLNLNPDVSIQIEGNTDSIPIRGRYQDNWELSTARANSIVRILVDKYDVDPESVVSVGHSYYDPVDTNSTPEGRAKNRRTDIVLSPNLEELYNLIGQQ